MWRPVCPVRALTVAPGGWVDLAAAQFVAGLVAYRVWRAVAVDDVTAAIRRPLEDRAGTSPRVDAVLHWLGCPWCAGFWFAGAVAVALIAWQGAGAVRAVIVWAGAATIVGLLGTR